jgi:uncharacterized protein YcbK (DUF882 family)
MTQWTENFNSEEFECGCGCGKTANRSFVEWLQQVRNDYGEKMLITSGARCQQHNDRIAGSARKSSHIDGMGADISVIYNMPRYRLVAAAIANGATGIGIYETHVHIDIKERSNSVLWTKR